MSRGNNTRQPVFPHRGGERLRSVEEAPKGPTRRDFLRGSGAVAVSAITVPTAVGTLLATTERAEAAPDTLQIPEGKLDLKFFVENLPRLVTIIKAGNGQINKIAFSSSDPLFKALKADGRLYCTEFGDAIALSVLKLDPNFYTDLEAGTFNHAYAEQTLPVWQRLIARVVQMDDKVALKTLPLPIAEAAKSYAIIANFAAQKGDQATFQQSAQRAVLYADSLINKQISVAGKIAPLAPLSFPTAVAHLVRLSVDWLQDGMQSQGGNDADIVAKKQQKVRDFFSQSGANFAAFMPRIPEYKGRVSQIMQANPQIDSVQLAEALRPLVFYEVAKRAALIFNHDLAVTLYQAALEVDASRNPHLLTSDEKNFARVSIVALKAKKKVTVGLLGGFQYIAEYKIKDQSIEYIGRMDEVITSQERMEGVPLISALISLYSGNQKRENKTIVVVADSDVESFNSTTLAGLHGAANTIQVAVN